MAANPSPVLAEGSDDHVTCRVQGNWTVQALRSRREVTRRVRAIRRQTGDVQWDLSALGQLDLTGALLLWHAWGRQMPARIRMPEAAGEVFALIDANRQEPAPEPPRESWAFVRRTGDAAHLVYEHGIGLLRLFGRVMFDLGDLLRHPARGPWREISAQIYHAGAQALGITALVGFLIGVVLSYLSSQQLALFGASVYIVDLLGVSVVRELGPVLAAILVAGRSGSAITAQIGVMRVTQELDAMLVMGIPAGGVVDRPDGPGGWHGGGRYPLESFADLVRAVVARRHHPGQFLDRAGQRGLVWCADRAHRLPFRLAGRTQYREPGAWHDRFGGSGDHRGHSR
jgi:phospholipid/cholesterol/gamma-HCH transport system permease protein